MRYFHHFSFSSTSFDGGLELEGITNIPHRCPIPRYPHWPVLKCPSMFGALDAQTLNDMETLLLRIWDEPAATVLLVAHDVAEGVFLADRLHVVSPRPGTIVEEIPVPFARPREQGRKEQREFQELEAHVLARSRRTEGAGQVRVRI